MNEEEEEEETSRGSSKRKPPREAAVNGRGRRPIRTGRSKLNTPRRIKLLEVQIVIEKGQYSSPFAPTPTCM